MNEQKQTATKKTTNNNAQLYHAFKLWLAFELQRKS